VAAAIPPKIWIGAAGAIALLGLIAYLQRPPVPEAPAPLTGEAKAYVKNLRLADVTMEAAESYLKQPLVEIQGNIGNAGGRVLQRVEVNCVFRDAYGQVVLRERVAIAGGRRSGSLAPGETRAFRLAFDNIPESWNQAMPDLVIAQIVFA
jgi:hypothetical protein